MRENVAIPKHVTFPSLASPEIVFNLTNSKSTLYNFLTFVKLFLNFVKSIQLNIFGTFVATIEIESCLSGLMSDVWVVPGWPVSWLPAVCGEETPSREHQAEDLPLRSQEQLRPQSVGGQQVRKDLLPHSLKPFPIISINRNDLLSPLTQ